MDLFDAEKPKANMSKRYLFRGVLASLLPVVLLSNRSALAADEKTTSGSLADQDCSDITALRNIEPQSPNQSIKVQNYYSVLPSPSAKQLSYSASSFGKEQVNVKKINGGGGDFYYDATDKTSKDDGGMVVVTREGKRWKRKLSGNDKIQAAYYGVSPLLDDNGPALQAAVNFSSNRIVELPRGILTVKTPIIFDLDSGVKLEGAGKKGGTIIDVRIGPGYEDMGALHFAGRHGKDRASPGYRALSIKNIHLIGNLSRCRGIFLQYQFAMRLEQVTIEKFDGAGLYIDKCQDSVFEQVDVFNCGRTSGERALLTDGFDESKTIDSPIIVTSSIPKDDCNYLRFLNCQWEDNPVSPVCDFSGGIENYFINIHAEYSHHWKNEGTTGGTLFKQRKGTIKLQGGGSDEIKNLVDIDWGEFWVESHRCNPPKNIKVKDGTNSRLTFRDVSLDKVTNLTTSGEKRFEGCTINEVNLHYPDGFLSFSSCNIRKGFTSEQSGNSLKLYILACNIEGGVKIPLSTKSVLIDDCTVGQDVSFGSENGMWLNNNIKGLFHVASGGCKVILSSSKQLIGIAPPKEGFFAVGDTMKNVHPSAGGFIGWVCVKEGKPGDWKGYGKIVD
ncbi:hypothetical protein [Serratia liquefaciens]|uniref:hypothetical protein n=1 Tax=Serratia liquefaciens TaxID=614 RepID=UPI0022B9953A|nr:hypothetical protein [Serratia liquefaciens]